MSDEIEKLVDQFADTYFHYRLDKRLRLYTEATKQKHDAARSALLSRIAEVETERDDLLKILKDPFAVHTNILIGRIALPDYYIRKTDSDGEYAHLETERDEWRSVAASLAEEYSPSDQNNHSGGCPRRRMLQGWTDEGVCTCGYEAKFTKFRELEKKYPSTGVKNECNF